VVQENSDLPCRRQRPTQTSHSKAQAIESICTSFVSKRAARAEALTSSSPFQEQSSTLRTSARVPGFTQNGLPVPAFGVNESFHTTRPLKSKMFAFAILFISFLQHTPASSSTSQRNLSP
jgi:hypothetical protein